MKTYVPKDDEIQRDWYVVDATGQPLGRLAAAIARVLRGKHKPIYSPDKDTGDHVIVINAEKVLLTGKKLQQKQYFRHSGRPGGAKFETAEHLLERIPERLIERAVWGMLPHNRLGRRMYRKLRVYAGETHPHQGQKPRPLSELAGVGGK